MKIRKADRERPPHRPEFDTLERAVASRYGTPWGLHGAGGLRAPWSHRLIGRACAVSGPLLGARDAEVGGERGARSRETQGLEHYLSAGH